MNKLFATLLFLVFYAFAVDVSFAMLHHGTFTPPSCTRGVFAGDGCQSAPAPLTASFGRSNVFFPSGYVNTVAATTANYMATNCGPSSNLPCHQVFNQAGNADQGYHIGYYSTSSQMNCVGVTIGQCIYDPATWGVGGANHVPGCTYSAIGNAGGGPLLVCGGTGFAGTLQHVNFGPVGGHDCTAVEITNPPAGVTERPARQGCRSKIGGQTLSQRAMTARDQSRGRLPCAAPRQLGGACKMTERSMSSSILARAPLLSNEMCRP
jgi:hypothetical protein